MWQPSYFVLIDGSRTDLEEKQPKLFETARECEKYATEVCNKIYDDVQNQGKHVAVGYRVLLVGTC